MRRLVLLQDRGGSAVLPLACALLACQLLIALALIPPWQQPDESTHVARVELQRSRITGLDGSPDPARESEILQSMAYYDWWEHRNVRSETPAIIPRDFNTAGNGVALPAQGVDEPTAYTVIAGRILSWFPRLSVVGDLYILRALSAVCGLLTLWIAWLGARECLGRLGGMTVAFLLALHPQFAVVSTAAAADGLVNLFGACLWWQTTLAVKRTHVLLPLAGVWCAALAAASADRMGVPLLLVASVVSVAVALLRRPSWGRRAIVAVAAAAVFAVVAIGAALWTLESFGETFGLRVLFSQSWSLVPGAQSWTFFTRFSSILHQTWWFSLGWVRYAPPAWWTAVAITLAAIATVGTGQRLVRIRELDAQTRMLIALAVIGLVVQASGVYWNYFRLGHGAQGKSLFPVLIPCLVLFWAGIEAWVPPRQLRHEPPWSVLKIAGGPWYSCSPCSDAAAWSLVAIPAYYASL